MHDDNKDDDLAITKARLFLRNRQAKNKRNQQCVHRIQVLFYLYLYHIYFQSYAINKIPEQMYLCEQFLLFFSLLISYWANYYLRSVQLVNAIPVWLWEKKVVCSNPYLNNTLTVGLSSAARSVFGINLRGVLPDIPPVTITTISIYSNIHSKSRKL